mgnify:CR=1 FL=1
MKIPTWTELCDFYCTNRVVREGSAPYSVPNPCYEPFATRRYNYSPSLDTDAVRLVFLKDGATEGKTNRTLMRDGRFIWCKNLEYEGRNVQGHRQISFTVDNGKKRFLAAENNILCLPAKTFVAHIVFFNTRKRLLYHSLRYFPIRTLCVLCAGLLGYRQVIL